MGVSSRAERRSDSVTYSKRLIASLAITLFGSVLIAPMLLIDNNDRQAFFMEGRIMPGIVFKKNYFNFVKKLFLIAQSLRKPFFVPQLLKAFVSRSNALDQSTFTYSINQSVSNLCFESWFKKANYIFQPGKAGEPIKIEGLDSKKLVRIFHRGSHACMVELGMGFNSTF